MLMHIVMLRAKAQNVETKKQQLEQLKQKLEALPAKIPQIKHYEVGIHLDLQTPGASTYHLVLTSGFDNQIDLESYRVHPEHQKVVAYINQIASERAVVDYYQS